MGIRSTRSTRILVILLVVCASALMGSQWSRGLDLWAVWELHAVGVDKYIGEFTPATTDDLGDGWMRHTFDSDGGDGPICISDTPFLAFSRARDPEKVLVFLQGGGACWQDFYFCTIESDPDPIDDGLSGIWLDSFDTGDEIIANPLADWSIVYASYCDGSVFVGDNAVEDPNFPFGPVRHHRGLRNASATMDLAKDLFPDARRVLISGSSAGGVGASGFAPFLARFAFGNRIDLSVFNDAGPVAVNLDDTGGIEARAEDWQFGQFYPPSCTECSDVGQPAAAIDWGLRRDRTIRAAFYSTDGDSTNRFFLSVPTQEEYRELLLSVHGELHDLHPWRYKSFIRSGDDEHTALQLDTFYLGEANGVPLYQWTDQFLNNRWFWRDIVEDFVPLP